MSAFARRSRPLIAAALAVALLPAIAYGARPGTATTTVGMAIDRLTDFNAAAGYYQCPVEPGMGENDEYTARSSGSLAPGASYVVSNPRPSCMGMVARAEFRWVGSGKAPLGLRIEIVDPTGAVHGQVVLDGRLGSPTWARACFENQSSPYFGTYSYRIVNGGTSVAKDLTFVADLRTHETDIQGCGWWPPI